MKFIEAVLKCHVRSSIYRKAIPDKLYPNNSTKSLAIRIPVEEQMHDDWEEYDPKKEVSNGN
jgi:hypothetical protein